MHGSYAEVFAGLVIQLAKVEDVIEGIIDGGGDVASLYTEKNRIINEVTLDLLKHSARMKILLENASEVNMSLSGPSIEQVLEEYKEKQNQVSLN